MHTLIRGFALLSVLVSSLATSSTATAQLVMPPPLSAPARGAIVITNTTVIDVTNGAHLTGVNVVVEGNRIVRVDRTRMAFPQNAVTINGTGKFVIPGLWDFHVHSYNPGITDLYLPLYIANGVTGVREMFGSIDALRDGRARVANGTLVGPRVVGSGHILDGPKPVWPGSATAANAEQGRRAVDSLQALGANFIKVYSLLSRDAFVGIAAEARAKHIQFAGHVPEAVSITEASNAGMASMEHLNGFPLACSSREATLRAARDSALGSDYDTYRRKAASQALDIYRSFDSFKCAALYRLLVRNGSWQTPTLVQNRNAAYLDDTTNALDPRLKYLPKQMTAFWNPKTDFRYKDRTAEDWKNAKLFYARLLEITGAMAKAHVPLLAGTDVLNPYVLPGFSLHDELALLVKAGATPLQALQAATINPARWIGSTDSLGTVSKGKVADLVILDADPLLNIANTTGVHAVISDGRLYRKSDLEAILTRAASVNVP